DDTPFILSRENIKPALLAEKFQQSVEQAESRLGTALEKELAVLQADRSRAVSDARAAAIELAHWRDRPQAWLQAVLGGSVVILFGLGGLFLVRGVVQFARRRSSPRLALGSAFGLFIVALGMFGIAGRQVQPNPPRGDRDPVAHLQRQA